MMTAYDTKDTELLRITVPVTTVQQCNTALLATAMLCDMLLCNMLLSNILLWDCENS